MDELTQSFENININSNFDTIILLNIKKYLEIIHNEKYYNDVEVREVHDFWKNLNKVYKQNLIDYIHETLHYDNNLVKDYLKMENIIYKSNIYLFTYYLIQNLY
jgi:hypothetical protein